MTRTMPPAPVFSTTIGCHFNKEEDHFFCSSKTVSAADPSTPSGRTGRGVANAK